MPALTVGELIELLRAFDPTLPMYIDDEEYGEQPCGAWDDGPQERPERPAQNDIEDPLPRRVTLS